MNLPTSSVQVSSFAILQPGQTSAGVQVLRGRLTRDTTTVDAQGNQREYPRGAELVLRKDRGAYSLLILTPAEPLTDEAAQAAINDACDPHGAGEVDIPF